MEQNIENKIGLIQKLATFAKENKKKLIFFFVIIIIFSFSLISLNLYKTKKNEEISEKYIKGGIFLTSNELSKSKEIFEEIIISENKFYSILALNIILEKELEKDENKVLNYFSITEKVASTKTEKDLLLFKKALYLIKITRINEGRLILNKMIEDGSELKMLAEDVLNN